VTTTPSTTTGRRLFTAGMTVAGVAATILTLNPGAATAAENQNDPAYWNNQGEHPAVCFKHEGGWHRSDHGYGDGTTFTLGAYQDGWDGDHWELLVVKAGPGRIVTQHPTPGVAYTAPDGKDISHVIVCKGSGVPEVEDTTTTVTEVVNVVDTTLPEADEGEPFNTTTTTPTVDTMMPPVPSPGVRLPCALPIYTGTEWVCPTATTPPAAVLDLSVTAVGEPPVPVTEAAPAALPATGSGTWFAVAVASLLLAAGAALTYVRRPRVS